jgi:hypothetical protein
MQTQVTSPSHLIRSMKTLEPYFHKDCAYRSACVCVRAYSRLLHVTKITSSVIIFIIFCRKISLPLLVKDTKVKFNFIQPEKECISLDNREELVKQLIDNKLYVEYEGR